MIFFNRLAATVALCIISTSGSFAINRVEQRIQYNVLMENMDKKALSAAEVEEQMMALKDYPLYPYLQAKYYQQHLTQISFDEITNFLSTYPTLAVNSSLRVAYEKVLINDKKWQQLVKLSQGSEAIVSQCHYYYAQWQLGKRAQALTGAEQLWLSSLDRPSDCNVLFDVYRASAMFTKNKILMRVSLTLQSGNSKLAIYLVNLLPASQSTLKKQLLQLIKDPTYLPTFASTVKPTMDTQRIVRAIFPRFVRKKPHEAQNALPKIVRAQRIKKALVTELEKSIVSNFMRDDISEQQKNWRDNFLTRIADGALLEQRIRLDLAKGEIIKAEKWIDHLPKEYKRKEAWIYWKGRALTRRNKNDEAKKLFESILARRNYYSMLSAQRLHVVYPIKKIIHQPKITADKLKRLEQNITMSRVEELQKINRLSYAIREWQLLLNGLPNDDIAVFAQIALRKNWALLSVQATIIGKLWNNLYERFPLPYVSIFKTELKGKAISYSYTMAIARQESALHPEIMSPAGARGLMQLMPRTAKETAKKIGYIGYSNVSQLLDPVVNIKLGTSYLDSMYQQFDRNRILSSAAYNAGPSRVTQWLARSKGKLEVDTFVESIPFNETRNYVKNVLMYDMIYRFIMGNSSKGVFSANELQRTY